MQLKEPYYVAEVEVPQEVRVTVNGLRVTVEGPKGKLERDFSHAKGVSIRQNENKVVVEAFNADRRKKALVGTIAAHIRNMITGVTKGYRYKLKFVFSHFPISVEVKGNQVIIKNFLGEKAPRRANILEGVSVKVVDRDIIVEGIDIEKVGQTAANIELATKIGEFDRRVFMDGIYIYERGVAE
jgi:large subunit ribosomal protein L6